MIVFVEKTSRGDSPAPSLTLGYQARQKSRLHTRLDDGTEVGIMLKRGETLRHRDIILAEDGTRAQVLAAPEHLTTLCNTDPMTLVRACYHLGNRHVPLQIQENKVSFLRDHVLEGMLTTLGLDYIHEEAGFEPENGAYHQHHSHD